MLILYIALYFNNLENVLDEIFSEIKVDGVSVKQYKDENKFKLTDESGNRIDENIKIVKAPNEMADYANEVYFMFDDIDDQHVKDMKRLVKQYSRVSDAVYFCAVDFETETNLDFTKYINSIIKENYSDEITKPQLVEIIKNELLERGIQAENGFGRLEIIVKGKSAKGKKTIPNIGIMLEGMNNRVPYSILNDYQYYMNEYTKNGWKIFVFYVDDIISKLQLRLNEVSSYLASKDQNVTHQLKIDEFID